MQPSGTNRRRLAVRLDTRLCALLLCALFAGFVAQRPLHADEPFPDRVIRIMPGGFAEWPPQPRYQHLESLTDSGQDTIFGSQPWNRPRPTPFNAPGLITPTASETRRTWDDPDNVFADHEQPSFRPLDEALPPECLSLDPAVPPGAELTQVSVCDPETGYAEFGIYPWSRFDENRSHLNFFAHDLRVGWDVIRDDAKGLFRARNVAFLGLGLGGALGLRQDADADVREWTARHPRRWGTGTQILDWMGRPEVHVPVMLSLYSWGMTQEDEDVLRFSRLLIRTYSLTTVSTVLVKVIANTDRPSQQWINGRYGFPSGHASTSFAIASTIEEYYGPRYGLPAYLLAGTISWSRIDDRDHDLSDVLFGAVLGYAIGKSVAGRELRGDSRIQFFPWTDPANRATGIGFQYDY